jgi:hypothetical protein
VLAAQSGGFAVGLALLPNRVVEATVLGPDNRGVDGLAVSFHSAGRTIGSKSCGPGCYRAVQRLPGGRLVIRLGASPAVSFELPRSSEPARTVVAEARRAYVKLRSLVIHERLASDLRHRVSTTWRLLAPNRLTYLTSQKARAVVIGAKRWDKIGAGPWRPSPQTPLTVPSPQWRGVVDAHVIGRRTIGGRRARVVTFFDPSLPAWFELALDPQTERPLELTMMAAAHFMHHRYGGFNAPLRIVPPA